MTFKKGGAGMADPSIVKECSDPTQALTIDIPCVLAKRIERYAKNNEATVTGVMSEALDTFLRKSE
jgi:hypothetical protein